MHLCTTSPSRPQAPLPGCTPLSQAEGTRFRWMAEGWKPGNPPDLDPADAAVDLLCCRQLVCGTCRKRGLDYHPFHRSRSLRVLGVCGRCQAVEEV